MADEKKPRHRHEIGAAKQAGLILVRAAFKEGNVVLSRHLVADRGHRRIDLPTIRRALSHDKAHVVEGPQRDESRGTNKYCLTGYIRDYQMVIVAAVSEPEEGRPVIIITAWFIGEPGGAMPPDL
jgi:hypothetical protein